MYVFDFVLMAIDLPLFIFHCSLLVFVGIQIKRHHNLFSSPFYKLFFTVVVTDSFLFVTVYLDRRFTSYGWFTSWYLADTNGRLATIFFAITIYLHNLQIYLHFLAVFNRFCFTCLKEKPWVNTLWSQNGLLWLLAICFMWPLSLLLTHLPHVSKYFPNVDGTISTIIVVPDFGEKYAALGSSVLCTILVVVAFYFNIRIAMVYRHWVKSGRVLKNNERNDIRLLLHSFFIFACQTLMTAYQFTYIYIAKTQRFELIHFVRLHHIWILDLRILGNSLFIFIVSSTLRRHYLMSIRSGTTINNASYSRPPKPINSIL
ncbi:hypothetical protein M3Y96_00630000 [Aphelenchoides besseyi]|nr:hypothetical protein M3Y96_00630000 [Aphelenchoides besseyi]